MTMREYIEGNVANIRRGFGIELRRRPCSRCSNAGTARKV